MKPGDLVTIGLSAVYTGPEAPWGWDCTRLPDTRSKQMIRANLVNIMPGTVGLVVSFDHRGIHDYDVYYVVIVNGKNLGVPLRFLHRVETQ